MTAAPQYHSIRTQVSKTTLGNGIQLLSVLPLVRRLQSKGDIS
jgi:hypothetical protein